MLKLMVFLNIKCLKGMGLYLRHKVIFFLKKCEVDGFYLFFEEMWGIKLNFPIDAMHPNLQLKWPISVFLLNDNMLGFLKCQV